MHTGHGVDSGQCCAVLLTGEPSGWQWQVCRSAWETERCEAGFNWNVAATWHERSDWSWISVETSSPTALILAGALWHWTLVCYQHCAWWM